MKVLVYFQPKNPAKENFEGNRLALTLRGALETLHIKHTSKLVDDYDVAHFIAPDDENKVNIALEKGVPVIVSAMYCEDDPYASFLEHKNKDGVRSTELTPKALRFLIEQGYFSSCSLLRSREFLKEQRCSNSN